MRFPPARPSTALQPTLLGALLSSLLAACGGGSSGDTTPPPPPAAATVTLKGVAATGGALANATVTAKCATGTGTATTGADGSYSLLLPTTAVLPCLLEVATADGTLLHSVAASGSLASSGNTNVPVNLTPVTELVVAELTGKNPSELFGSFDSTAAIGLTPALVSSAATQVVATLKTGGVDLSAAGDVVGGTLTAANGSTAGNAYDQALDTLAASLSSSGSSLSELSQSVAANSRTSPTPPTTNLTPSLPPELQSLPSAAHCAALRSTTYRAVIPRYSDLGSQTTQFSMDAKTLKFTDLGDPDPNTNTDTWVANGDCRFIGSFGGVHKVDIVVSPSGLIVAKTFDGGDQKYRLAMAFPEQVHTVAELAGDWNMIGRELSSGTSATDAVYVGTTKNFTIGSTGAVSNIYNCQPLSTCGDVTGKTLNLSLNSTVTPTTGGFSLVSSTPGETWTDRVYVYKAGGGELMQFVYSGDGSYVVMTRKADNGAPTEGSLQRVWGLATDNTGAFSGNVSDSDWTNGAASGNSFARTSNIDGHVETLQVNTPRSGYNFRAATTATNSSGGTVNVSEFTALPLRGMGMSALWLPSIGTGGGVFFSPAKPSGTGNAALPANLLGKAYATTCAALRSGTYRMVQPRLGQAPLILTLSMNASNLSWTNSQGDADTWVPHATESCHFTDGASHKNDIVISQAGVITARVFESSTNTYQLTMGFPEQSHTLAELAGDWNLIGLELNSTSTGYNGVTGTYTADANGVANNVSWCENEATRGVGGADCQSVTSGVLAVSVNTSGGFDIGTTGGRMFVYRSGTGVMAMKVDQDGSFQVRTPVRTLSATVGRTNAQWNLWNTSDMTSPSAIGLSSFLNTAYNSATGALTRVSNDDGHVEVLMMNNPRAGFIHRDGIAAAPTSSGGTVAVREFTNLNLRDTMGISALWMPMNMPDQTGALGRLLMSVQVP